jgi:hypothetical protein
MAWICEQTQGDTKSKQVPRTTGHRVRYAPTSRLALIMEEKALTRDSRHQRRRRHKSKEGWLGAPWKARLCQCSRRHQRDWGYCICHFCSVGLPSLKPPPRDHDRLTIVQPTRRCQEYRGGHCGRGTSDCNVCLHTRLAMHRSLPHAASLKAFHNTVMAQRNRQGHIKQAS